MTTKKIYSPWIKWHGGECPVPPDTSVEVELRCGIIKQAACPKYYYWMHGNDGNDIVEYRIVTEQPDLEAAEKLLRDNGYTVIPPVKPLTFEDVVPLTEAPPKDTEYWAVLSYCEQGVQRFYWDDHDFDKTVLRHRMAYLDKAHALIAARHIFGLKGGEL